MKEVSFHDESGEQNGPARLVWANGAVREGRKRNGRWDGEVTYTFPARESKHKTNKRMPKARPRVEKELWRDGTLVSSQVLKDLPTDQGQDEGPHHQWEVEGWDDLTKMEDLTKDCLPSSLHTTMYRLG